MLRSLDIRDILIIDHLELEFQPGLNVLTGETGAGKSILLDALGFVLGWRGRADLVRQGAAQGEVTAVFDVPNGHPAQDILTDAGIPCEGELLLRRVNTADGRKTAWINDRRTSGDVLRRLSETLVELHGQHDDRGLLNAKGHRALLDAYGDYAPLLEEVRHAWKARREAAAALAAAEETLEKARSEEEFLRHAVDELAALAPEEGEDENLDARRRMMQAASRIGEDIRRAEAALGGEGAEGRMIDAMRWLEGAAESAEGQLDASLAALTRAMTELDEAASGVRNFLDMLDFDPFELERVEERLFALRAMARKHHVAPEALPALAETLSGRLASLDAGADELTALAHAAEEAKARYAAVAGQLTAARVDASARLDAAVQAELAPLKMERAVFETRLNSTAPSDAGVDEVNFTVATNPGAPAGPLAKIASGGELSRFLLALKVCLTKTAGQMTMIFDEIDRGVGGATADAVGRRLAQIADGGQVLVVTHSPQVAALGAHHWRVEKNQGTDETLSRVIPLSAQERVDEIARMLAGDTVTPEARAAAEALLKAVG